MIDQLVQVAVRKLDQAATRGVIHKNASERASKRLVHEVQLRLCKIGMSTIPRDAPSDREQVQRPVKSKSKLEIPRIQTGQPANNGLKKKERVKGHPVQATLQSAANASWALDAWKRHRSDPELKVFAGKYVAIFESKVIASGDDFGAVLRKAIKVSGAANEGAILIDYWGQDGTFHESEEV